MKYLCLVYMHESTLGAIADSECHAFGQPLHKSGRIVAAEALHPVHTATTVRVREGKVRAGTRLERIIDVTAGAVGEWSDGVVE